MPEYNDRAIEALRRVLARLSPREEKVIRMRFGVGEQAIYSHAEIATQFGVDQQEIRNIESIALRKLLRPPSPLVSLTP
ncbi:MAG: hypothetical protein NTX72_05880 [Candidatus Uhrbacteria bacterium]|nr:hypothetical protein [Candidatus Uhrbacteria bacterium]